MKYAIYCFFCVLMIVVKVKSHNNGASRSNSVNEDNFNILLNIYKRNPLRRSKIYNTLYNKILSPRPDASVFARNINLIESTKEKEVKTDFHLKQIEKVIGTTKGHAKGIKPPAYQVRNLDPEILNEVNILTTSAPNNIEHEMNGFYNKFEDVLEHLGSNEINENPEVITDINNTNERVDMVIFENNKVITKVNNGTSITKSAESLPKAYYVYNTHYVSEKTLPYKEDVVILMK